MRALCLLAMMGVTLSGCVSAHRAWTNELDSCVSPCDECGPQPYKSCLFNKKGLGFRGSRWNSCDPCGSPCGDCGPCGGCSPCMTDCGSSSGGCSSCAQGQVIYNGAPMSGGSSCQTCQQNGMAIPSTPGSEYSAPGQPTPPTPGAPPAAAPQGTPEEQAPAPEPTHARMMQQMQPTQQVIYGQPMQMQPVNMQPMQMQSVPGQSVQMQPLQMVPQQTMTPQAQSQRTKAQSVRHQEWLPMTPMAPNQMPPGMQTQVQSQPTGGAVQPVLWVPAQTSSQTTSQPQNQVIYQQAPLQTTTTAPLLVPAR